MSHAFSPLRDATLIAAVEQFYYFEAHLLDERLFMQWLGLWREDGIYRMPNRFVAQADLSQRGSERFHAIDNELSRHDAAGLPLREENLFQLALRADRALKHNAWAENPPARCRRFVSNVMLQMRDDAILARSNFQLVYNRHTQPSVIYTGQRRDQLMALGDSFVLREREVILDWNVIAAPTVGIFF